LVIVLLEVVVDGSYPITGAEKWTKIFSQ